MVSTRIKRAHKVAEELFGKTGKQPHPDKLNAIHKKIPKIDGRYEKVFGWEDAEDYEVEWAEAMQEEEGNVERFSNAQMAILAAQNKDKNAADLPPSMTGTVKVAPHFKTQSNVLLVKDRPLFSNLCAGKTVVVIFIRFSDAHSKNFVSAGVSVTNQAMDWQQRMKLDHPLILVRSAQASLTKPEPTSALKVVVTELLKLGSTPIIFAAGLEGFLGPNEAYGKFYNMMNDINPTIAAETKFVLALHDKEVQSHPAKENHMKIITDGTTHRYCLEVNLKNYVENPKYHEKTKWFEFEMAMRVHGRDKAKAPQATVEMLKGKEGLMAQRILISKNVKRYAKYGWMGSVEEETAE